MKINKILYVVFGLVMLASACDPIEKNYGLGDILPKSDLKFAIAPSAENPNKIVLTSKTSGVIPRWITPVGVSTRATDTVTIAFPGTYKFVYGALCKGGYVESDTFKLTVTTIDREYVSTPKWVNLAGGYGKSKTWVLDVNANGKSKVFAGPVYFAGVDYSWEWDAGWASWIMPAGDYGSMTFDLIGNANFKADNKMLPELSGTGKFMLYPDQDLLATFDAQVIHDKTKGAEVLNWYAKMKIKTLDANRMQLIAVTSGGWSIYNYVSKDYYDSH